MKKDLTFGAIQEKMKDVVVEGQCCCHDCQHSYWVGNKSKKKSSCKKRYHADAFWIRFW